VLNFRPIALLDIAVEDKNPLIVGSLAIIDSCGFSIGKGECVYSGNEV